MLKSLVVSAICCLISSFTFAQSDSVFLNHHQVETIFFNNNLKVLAERFEIPISEAQLRQAQLWDNPGLTISDVNVYTTQQQKLEIEPMPLFGKNHFGQYQQFAIVLDQLIYTAGERKNRIKLALTSVKMTELNYDQIIWELRFELYELMIALQQTNKKLQLWQNHFNYLDQLAKAMEKQVERGFVSKSEYVRIKSLALNSLQQSYEIEKEQNEKTNYLKLLLQIPQQVTLQIQPIEYSLSSLEKDQEFLLLAEEHNKELKLANSSYEIAQQQLHYQKSLSIPNIQLGAQYDRGGGIYRNFLGVNVQIDIPLFNRNQGNIKSAQQAKMKQEIERENVSQNVKLGIINAWQQYRKAIQFYELIENGFETDMDEMYEKYFLNFNQRNLSLLEFVDFLESYIQNKSMVIDASNQVLLQAEKLNYQVGKIVIQ